MGGISSLLGGIIGPDHPAGALQTFGTQGVIPTLTGSPSGPGGKFTNSIGPAIQAQQNSTPTPQQNAPAYNQSIFNNLDLNHYGQEGGPQGINFMNGSGSLGVNSPTTPPASSIVPIVNNKAGGSVKKGDK